MYLTWRPQKGKPGRWSGHFKDSQGKWLHHVQLMDNTFPWELREQCKPGAERRMHQLAHEEGMIAAGFVPRCFRQLKRPLKEHVAEYFKAWRGNERNFKGMEKKLNDLLECCGFTQYPDINGGDVNGFLNKMLDAGKQPGTANGSLRVIKAFCNWMVDDGRAEKNPVAYLSAYPVRPREWFVPERSELDRLLASTGVSDRIWRRAGHFTGEDRQMAYVVAVGSGLTCAVMALLKPASFNFGESGVCIHIPERRGRVGCVVQPLRCWMHGVSEEHLNMLQMYLLSKEQERSIWPGLANPDIRLAKMIRLDFADAEIDNGKLPVGWFSFKHAGKALSPTGRMVEGIKKVIHHESPLLV